MAYILNKHNYDTGLKLFFVRHAESMNNIQCHDNPLEYESMRSHDPLLSPQGYEQAAQLANYIRLHEPVGNLVESKP
jgi:broad specificity phosphatase PhoE